MENEGLTDIDCVGGEMNRVRFVENETFFHWDPAFDLGVRSGVESRRIVH